MDEEKWYRFWEEEGFFKATTTSSKTPYSLLMPPPNLTGELHLGHAMQHSIIDAIARFKRMQGFDVLLLPGVDHAGIQFEGTLNKILIKEGLSKQKLGREKWLEKAWQFKDEIYKSFHQTWIVFGLSADWSREVFSLEPKVQQAVFEEFKTFWEQDLLYKGAYIVQWCPKCGTAIEDLEMEYEERPEKLYYVNYPVEGTKNQYITIATARPETIYADTGIAIYPHHPKFKKFVGRTAQNPLSQTSIPIFEDKRVDKKFGTGALKITPGHDPLDYEIGKNHNLPILHAIDKTGQMTKLAGELLGLTINQARQKAAEKLAQLGVIEKTDNYIHSVPACERCKTTIEPLISEEWFVRMKPLAEKALKNIKKINFVPKNYLKIISSWLGEIHDWSISRSLWWGIRIPVWYCLRCNPHHQVGKDKDMAISLKAPAKSCQTCQEKHWVQDEQVLDTWFSSGLWPLATLGWPQKPIELNRYYPWDFEISAPEIKYLWIARMIMLGLWFQDDVPFKNMFFHGMLRDFKGRKFSKSLGNGIDPNELRDRWGTDATRMALLTYSAPGRDGRLSKQTIDERCQNFRNFGTKVQNIARFIIDLKPKNALTESNFSHPDDQKIIKQLHQAVLDITKNLELFNLHLAIDKLYNFIWHQLADVYLEKSKSRRVEAQPCLEHVFKACLKLLHPFMPFTTEGLWQKLPHTGKSIMLTSWPKVGQD